MSSSPRRRPTTPPTPTKDQPPAQQRVSASGAPPKTGATASKKPNALQTPLQPTPELAAVIGAAPLSRSAAVKKIWDYIKANKLQNPKDRREILADTALRKVFGADKVSMFQMNKHLSAHLS